MKSRAWVCLTVLALVAGAAHADSTPAAKPAAGQQEKPLAAGKPAMDPKAMEAMMEKLAAPGPNHERFKKLEGSWDAVVKWSMGPDQPVREDRSTSMVRTLMDGRYMQEEVSGIMMGKPFSGMSITGYDNIMKMYVASWIDNVGTGIMTSTGTPDASGNVIHWTGESSDPMTGKMARYRMVTRFADDDHFTYEMYAKGPDGKEAKVMEIQYTRKM